MAHFSLSAPLPLQDDFALTTSRYATSSAPSHIKATFNCKGYRTSLTECPPVSKVHYTRVRFAGQRSRDRLRGGQRTKGTPSTPIKGLPYKSVHASTIQVRFLAQKVGLTSLKCKCHESHRCPLGAASKVHVCSAESAEALLVFSSKTLVKEIAAPRGKLLISPFPR
ncbi:unnamed protein product [Ixodes persulcatus]